ncbi:MAG: 6-bladed beta-propeller [Balneolaceae bacterium]
MIRSTIVVGLFLCSCTSGEPQDEDWTAGTQPVIPENLQDVENLTVLPEDAEPLYTLDLVPEAVYGNQEEDSVYIGYANDFVVDHTGHVYITDMSRDVIYVYAPEGSYLRTIGRSGQGPGEFQTIHGGLIVGVNDDFLYVYDSTNLRISTFSLETHSLVKTDNLDPARWSHLEDNTRT